MPLRKNPQTRKALPASAKNVITAYLHARPYQLRVARSRFERNGQARYPHDTPKGALAIAHMRDRLERAFGKTDGHDTGQNLTARNLTATWYSLCLVAARAATNTRLGRPEDQRGTWPPEAQAEDLALQAALLTVIVREAGGAWDPDVHQWLVGRWLAAGLPLG